MKLLELSNIVQILDYCKRKKEELYASKNPQKSREEFVAETSTILLEKVLSYEWEKVFPGYKSVLDFLKTKSARELGEFVASSIKFYCQMNGMDKDGKERSGEQVVKELAYKCLKSFLLKKMLGD